MVPNVFKRLNKMMERYLFEVLANSMYAPIDNVKRIVGVGIGLKSEHGYP